MARDEHSVLRVNRHGPPRLWKGSLADGAAVVDPTVGLCRLLDEAASDDVVGLVDGAGVALVLFGPCSVKSGDARWA